MPNFGMGHSCPRKARNCRTRQLRALFNRKAKQGRTYLAVVLPPEVPELLGGLLEGVVLESDDELGLDELPDVLESDDELGLDALPDVLESDDELGLAELPGGLLGEVLDPLLPDVLLGSLLLPLLLPVDESEAPDEPDGDGLVAPEGGLLDEPDGDVDEDDEPEGEAPDELLPGAVSDDPDGVLGVPGVVELDAPGLVDVPGLLELDPVAPLGVPELPEAESPPESLLQPASSAANILAAATALDVRVNDFIIGSFLVNG